VYLALSHLGGAGLGSFSSPRSGGDALSWTVPRPSCLLVAPLLRCDALSWTVPRPSCLLVAPLLRCDALSWTVPRPSSVFAPGSLRDAGASRTPHPLAGARGREEKIRRTPERPRQGIPPQERGDESVDREGFSPTRHPPAGAGGREEQNKPQPASGEVLTWALCPPRSYAVSPYASITCPVSARHLPDFLLRLHLSLYMTSAYGCQALACGAQGRAVPLPAPLKPGRGVYGCRENARQQFAINRIPGCSDGALWTSTPSALGGRPWEREEVRRP